MNIHDHILDILGRFLILFIYQLLYFITENGNMKIKQGWAKEKKITCHLSTLDDVRVKIYLNFPQDLIFITMKWPQA